MKPILVADDSVTVVRLLAHALRDVGCEVLTALDGEAALVLIRERRPALVIIDAEMPKLTGYEVCEAVHDDAEDDRPHLIMLTAGGREADRERAERAGVDEFLTKPFSPSALRARVRELLGEAP